MGLRLQLAIKPVVKLMVLVIVGSFIRLRRGCKDLAWCLTRELRHLLVIGFALVRLG